MSNGGAKAGNGTLRTALETLEDRTRIDGKRLTQLMKLPRLHLPVLFDCPDAFFRQGCPLGDDLW